MSPWQAVTSSGKGRLISSQELLVIMFSPPRTGFQGPGLEQLPQEDEGPANGPFCNLYNHQFSLIWPLGRLSL